ncbi:MAG TPA: hypothetical protein VLV89_14045, partial [Candidatus Acidoferrum sp.]|nr:hypothetical protein [Candidatus Acidoferrum sp.]
LLCLTIGKRHPIPDSVPRFVAGAVDDGEAGIFGEGGIGFREGAEVKTGAAGGVDFEGVAAIEAEAYAAHFCGVFFTLWHDLRLPHK